MLYSTLVIAATAFTGFASAQNYSTSGPLNVTASQVPLVQRQAWCRGERETCPKLCSGQAYPNECHEENLSYTCVCTDGSKPNITDYDQTLPAFICAQWIENCVDSHPNDLAGITACRSVVCGSKNATALFENNTSSSSSSSAASTTTAPTTTSSAGSNAASTTATTTSSRTGAATALAVGQSVGTTVLSLGLLGLFGLAL